MIELIAWIFVCFFSTYGITFLYLKFNNCKINKCLKFYLLFIFGWLIISVLMFYNNSLLRLFFYFAFYPVLFYIIKPLPIRRLLYYTFIVWFLGVFLDLCAMLFVSVLNKMFGFDLLTNWSVASLILTFVVFIFLIIIGKISKLCMFVNKLYDKLINVKYSNCLLAFLVFYVFILAFVIFSSLPNLNINLLLSLLIFLVLVVFIFLVKYKIDEEEIDKYLKILKENNEFYVNVDDENRIFKHNLIAKLLSIKSVSNRKSMLLIDNLILEFSKNIGFSNHIKIIPYGLNGIIYQKLYSVFDKLEIKITNSIDYDIFDVLKPIRYNVLVEKLSLALDNAIEACLNSHDRILIINIYDVDNNIIIEIKNTFSDIIDLDEIGSKNYSTKGKKRGLGLFSMLRNNEATLTVNIINDFFVNKIVVQKISN